MNQPSDLWHVDDSWKLGSFPGEFLDSRHFESELLPIALEFGNPKEGFEHIRQKRRRPIDLLAKKWAVDQSYSIPWLIWFKCNQLLKVYHQGGGRFQLVGFQGPGCEIIVALHQSKLFMKVITAIPGTNRGGGDYLGTIGPANSPKKPWPSFSCPSVTEQSSSVGVLKNSGGLGLPTIIVKKKRSFTLPNRSE